MLSRCSSRGGLTDRALMLSRCSSRGGLTDWHLRRVKTVRMRQTDPGSSNAYPPQKLMLGRELQHCSCGCSSVFKLGSSVSGPSLPQSMPRHCARSLWAL